jgi:hypothetical protein
VPTVRGLGAAVAVVAAIVGIAFAPVALLDRAILAGFLGLALATALVAVTRPPGLVAAWRYLRELA